MKFDVKILLLILVVLLLGTNVATVATYWLHTKADTTQTKSKIEIPDTQFGRFFNDQLNLNEEQQEHFREFRRKYNRSANQVLIEMQQIRTGMAATLKNPHPDRQKLDNLAVKLGDKHRQLKGLTFDYYFNMQSVLDEKQQEKMVDIFQAMLTESGDAKTPLPGGNGRQGQGQGSGRGQGWRSVHDSTLTGNK